MRIVWPLFCGTYIAAVCSRTTCGELVDDKHVVNENEGEAQKGDKPRHVSVSDNGPQQLRHKRGLISRGFGVNPKKDRFKFLAKFYHKKFRRYKKKNMVMRQATVFLTLYVANLMHSGFGLHRQNPMDVAQMMLPLYNRPGNTDGVPLMANHMLNLAHAQTMWNWPQSLHAWAMPHPMTMSAPPYVAPAATAAFYYPSRMMNPLMYISSETPKTSSSTTPSKNAEPSKGTEAEDGKATSAKRVDERKNESEAVTDKRNGKSVVGDKPSTEGGYVGGVRSKRASDTSGGGEAAVGVAPETQSSPSYDGAATEMYARRKRNWAQSNQNDVMPNFTFQSFANAAVNKLLGLPRRPQHYPHFSYRRGGGAFRHAFRRRRRHRRRRGRRYRGRRRYYQRRYRRLRRNYGNAQLKLRRLKYLIMMMNMMRITAARHGPLMPWMAAGGSAVSWPMVAAANRYRLMQSMMTPVPPWGHPPAFARLPPLMSPHPYSMFAPFPAMPPTLFTPPVTPPFTPPITPLVTPPFTPPISTPFTPPTVVHHEETVGPMTTVHVSGSVPTSPVVPMALPAVVPTLPVATNLYGFRPVLPYGMMPTMVGRK